MLQDLTNNKKTEIDAINGHIIYLAEQYALPAKINKKILTQLKEMYVD
jgi:ketopantoate reductase